MLTAEQEQQIIEHLAGSEDDQFATFQQAERHAGKIIREVCGCSDEEADGHLTSLRDRALLDVDITPRGGPIVGRMQEARWICVLFER